MTVGGDGETATAVGISCIETEFASFCSNGWRGAAGAVEPSSEGGRQWRHRVLAVGRYCYCS